MNFINKHLHVQIEVLKLLTMCSIKGANNGGYGVKRKFCLEKNTFLKKIKDKIVKYLVKPKVLIIS